MANAGHAGDGVGLSFGFKLASLGGKVSVPTVQAGELTADLGDPFAVVADFGFDQFFPPCFQHIRQSVQNTRAPVDACIGPGPGAKGTISILNGGVSLISAAARNLAPDLTGGGIDAWYGVVLPVLKFTRDKRSVGFHSVSFGNILGHKRQQVAAAHHAAIAMGQHKAAVGKSQVQSRSGRIIGKAKTASPVTCLNALSG